MISTRLTFSEDLSGWVSPDCVVLCHASFHFSCSSLTLFLSLPVFLGICSWSQIGRVLQYSLIRFFTVPMVCASLISFGAWFHSPHEATFHLSSFSSFYHCLPCCCSDCSLLLFSSPGTLLLCHFDWEVFVSVCFPSFSLFPLRLKFTPYFSKFCIFLLPQEFISLYLIFCTFLSLQVKKVYYINDIN